MDVISFLQETPQEKAAADAFYSTANARRQARFEAKKHVFREIYRHQMRYEPRIHQQEFALTDDDVSLIESHYAGVDYDGYQVTINTKYVTVDQWEDFEVSVLKLAKKACTKVYVREPVVSLEVLDKEGNFSHYHLNFLFYKKCEWLAKSRVLQEFYNTFKDHVSDIQKVDVKPFNESDFAVLSNYILKENLWVFSKNEKIKSKDIYSDGLHEVRQERSFKKILQAPSPKVKQAPKERSK